MKNRLFNVAAFVVLAVSAPLAFAQAPLRLSVYTTAGDVLRYLSAEPGRQKALAMIKPLKISRLFLEGRRGDEYAPPELLRQTRDFFAQHDIDCAGGIATVPGQAFGVRQNGGFGWLNWESDQTQRDVASFFTENAPLFQELIVDDFYCTADTSPASDSARGGRSWPEYRRDLLVSLIDPLMIQPARAVNPSVRMILKFPQWYDRFHLFGYDPPRMSAPFDQIWVGAEVRNPETRRMGFVQPTEGYINFRWLASVAGKKVVGAWFDHIECTPQNFVDQAFQSVIAGAQELTLFHLGDLMEGHPGDALLARRLPELFDLAAKIHRQRREGIAFFKPPGSDADEDYYLMDYLAMLGLPILPHARYPADAKVAVLGVQAAADPAIIDQARQHLKRGATLLVTPAFVRKTGKGAAEMAGVDAGVATAPVDAAEAELRETKLAINPPLEVDASLKATRATTLIRLNTGVETIPLLTSHRVGPGRVLVLNVRTFSEQDFRDAGEWLLAPKPRGLSNLPQPLANDLRRVLLKPLRRQFQAPAGVALYLFADGQCLYSFRNEAVTVMLDGKKLELAANAWLWETSR